MQAVTDRATVHPMPVQQRAALLEPTTYREDGNTIECVWTTGARVRRYDYWNDTPYDEELVVSPEAVDMSRFDAGAVQVLDNHRQYGGVAAILGIALRGWLDGASGRAELRLSQREELAGVVADIRAGVIRTISVGYSVQRYEIVRAQDRTDGVNVPLYRAVRWKPAELSFVTVPADAASGTRANPSQGHSPCEFVRASAHLRASAHPSQQEHPMGPTTAPAPDAQATEAVRSTAAATAAASAAPVAAAAPAAAPTAEQALQRAADITELCNTHRAPELAARLIRENATLDQARAAILNARAAADESIGDARRNVVTVRDEFATRIAGMTEALMHRVDARAALTDNGRQYRGMSLLEIGRDHLEACGVSTRGMDRMALASRMLTHRSSGMHSTSDLSSILANVANKRLRGAYDENAGTYRRWARRAPNAPDFKNITVAQLSAMPDLLQVNEHGEFKYGSLKDGAETYALLTYGRIVSLTRQAIVNDDLRAFDRMVTAYGAAAMRLENRTVYAQLTSNPTMADAVALFHATHANLGTGGGSALQFSSLTAARTAMRVQKGLQNEELNLAPAFLIGPAALEQTMYQLTSSNYVPATKAEVNEFRAGGRTAVEPIVEPILDASSATAWYAAAANSQVDTVEYCWLDGAEGPVIESEMGFEVDGLSLKCRLDFAAKVLDHRGLYKANGA